jgi:hypothetical protein
MGRVVPGSDRVVLGCWVKILGPCSTRDTVGSGLSFLVIIFGLDRVGLGNFRSSGENFDPCPT